MEGAAGPARGGATGPGPAAPRSRGTGAAPAGKTPAAGTRRRGAAAAAAPHPKRCRSRGADFVRQKSPQPSVPGGEGANLPRDRGWRRRAACTCSQGARPPPVPRPHTGHFWAHAGIFGLEGNWPSSSCCSERLFRPAHGHWAGNCVPAAEPGSAPTAPRHCRLEICFV